MRIDVLTIFPEMFENVISESIIKRAREAGRVSIFIHDIRQYSQDKHRKVDDRPYGGGSGMVMRPEPVFACAQAVFSKAKIPGKNRRVLMLSPRGRRLEQKDFKKFSAKKHLVLICGRYEGVDERICEDLCDEEVSIGDYVLTGGEIPAMVVIDATTRLLSGVLGNKESAVYESFQDGLLEYPQYTRPAVFRDKKVPDVLLSGDHPRIEAWRQKQSRILTKKRRPDLLEKGRIQKKNLNKRKNTLIRGKSKE